MSIGLGEYSLSRGPVGLNRFSIDNQRASMDSSASGLARPPLFGTTSPTLPGRPNKPPPPLPPPPAVVPETCYSADVGRFFHDPSTGKSSYVLPRQQLDAWIDSIIEGKPRQQAPPLPSRGERSRSRGSQATTELSTAGAEPDLETVEEPHHDDRSRGLGSGGATGSADEMWVAKLHVDTGQVYYQHRVYNPSYRAWTNGHRGQASAVDP